MDQQEPDEDYGYDLAHEVPAGPDQRGRHPHQPLGGQAPRPADINIDVNTDYGSDEAHDL